MSATDYLIDSTTRNAVYLQRLAGGESKKAIAYLDELQLKISGVMATGDFTQVRKDKIIQDVKLLNTEYLAEMSAQIVESAKNTGVYTAGFTKRLMDKAATVDFVLPSGQVVEQAVLNMAMDVTPGQKTVTVKDALDQYSTAKAGEINRSLADSLASNATKDQALNSIHDVMRTAKRQADTLVRTITNASANVGRLETLQENKRFLQGYEWVAKLDARTTLTCAGRDGVIYEFKSNNPMPPAHWGCRSQIVAALLPQYQEPNLKGERDAANGEITANTTYGA